MWQLVIETGGEACQVGLARAFEPVGGWRWDWPRQQAERLVWMAEEVLAVERLRWGDLSGIVVMIGPGSHTGLRVGLAAAKAWALRWSLLLYPVPLLRVLYEEGCRALGGQGRILTLWQARRDEVYGHLWEHSDGKGEIHPLRAWQCIEADLIVGNVPGLFSRWVSIREVSWMSVARTAQSVPPVTAPVAIAALTPLYFRAFTPTQRKDGPPLHSAPSS
jgi:tRNA threonylcarbamoyl adenosine modification protein YeaZ